jgi:3-hydroxyisobutyrate dehydrogenase
LAVAADQIHTGQHKVFRGIPRRHGGTAAWITTAGIDKGSATMAIGYVGLGSMGGALARRLQLQHPLHVYDLNAQSMQNLVGRGATACASLGAVAAHCDTILLCLPTSDQVRAVIFGPDGLAASAKPGTLIVDQTTGDPKATRAMAAELAGTGVELIDAPVSGGLRGAEAGTIAIMIGASPEQYERIRPILQAISPNLFHAGGVGNGHVAKVVNNMVSAAQRVLTLEAVALATKAGLEPRTAVSIMLASSGRNVFMEHFMAPHVLNGNLRSGFTLGLLHKDVRLATQVGMDCGATLFFGNVVREFYQMCINEMGGDAQVNTTALIMDRICGTQVVPANYQV